MTNPFLSGRRLEAAIGFAFWLALVVVLEPGNIARSPGGMPMGQEIARLLGAATLGAIATLAVFALVRARPIDGWRRALLHLGADAALAVALILVAGLLAALLLSEERRPLLVALRVQLAVDGPLLLFCLMLLTGAAQAIELQRARRGTARHLASVPVKLRGRIEMVALSDVAWIETQGNYLALHAGGAVHLIRETSRRFEAQLDPERFARIHRRTIVALGAVRRIEPLASGDATVTLADGTELRASRSYRDALTARVTRPA